MNSVSNSFCQIKSAWHREPFRHWRGSKKTDMDMKRLMQRLLPFVRGNTGLPQTSGRSALISDLSAVQILTVEGRLQMQVSAREGGGAPSEPKDDVTSSRFRCHVRRLHSDADVVCSAGADKKANKRAR